MKIPQSDRQTQRIRFYHHNHFVHGFPDHNHDEPVYAYGDFHFHDDGPDYFRCSNLLPQRKFLYHIIDFHNNAN